MKLMIMCLFFPYTSAHVTAKNDGQTKGPLAWFPSRAPREAPSAGGIAYSKRHLYFIFFFIVTVLGSYLCVS